MERSALHRKLKDLGVDDNLIQHKGLTPGMLLTLGEKKIKTLKDFAELSSDELIGGYDEKKGVKFKIDGYLEEFALSKNEADDLIINARNIVFKQKKLFFMEEKKKKKLTLGVSSKTPHNVSNYVKSSKKTSVLIEKKAPRRWEGKNQK